MGELYNLYPKLPRNIKQIGEKEETTRLYVEDYVSTYLKSLVPSGENDLRVGLLLGNLDERDGIVYLFLDGAMELENINAAIGNVEFTEVIWKKAYQDIEEHFPKRTIQGWFLCGAKGNQLKSVDYWKDHNQYFAGKHKLMYLNSGSEGEEEIYITREDGLAALKGYYIFYERNQMMQDYMIQRNDSKRTEIGVQDRVTRDFKDRMSERKGQFRSQRAMVRTLSGICGTLSVVVLAGGIVMANNYSQMRQMKSVIASVLPQGEEEQKTMELTDVGAGDTEVEIESVSGNVYPTEKEMTTETSIEMATETSEISTQTSIESEVKQAGEQENSLEKVLADIGQKESQVSKEQEETSKEQEETKVEKKEGKTESKSVGQSSKIPGGNQTASQAVSQEKSGLIETTDVSSGKTVRYYIVGEGETLNGICYKVYHNITQVEAICELNGLESQDKIMAGQKLELP